VIFTKTFFRLSELDQAKVVDAVIADIGREHWATPEDEKRAKRQIQRIRRKAVEHGIYAPDEKK
jgi:hypothetical protein